MNQKTQNKICILGLKGFPNSYSAKISRYKSITRMLSKKGNSVIVINREIGKNENKFLETIIVNSIGFKVNSYTISKYLKKLLNYFDFFRLLQIFKLKKINVIIVYTYSFPSLLCYKLYSIIFRAKLVLDYVEKRSQIPERRFNNMLNDWLFENIGLKFLDGAFVISEYLKNDTMKFLRSSKVYKLPPICSFDLFSKEKKNILKNTFCIAHQLNTSMSLILL